MKSGGGGGGGGGAVRFRSDTKGGGDTKSGGGGAVHFRSDTMERRMLQNFSPGRGPCSQQ